jgi:alkanesulfonate monooxygenase SsuD/methylene tetrahydromethanopterin reductase-like flavin-dependent oxidoreductase (luciferase family)
MVKFGYKLMTEEHGPADLVRNAQRAEQAGFDFAAISDHYFPWLEESRVTRRSPGRCWALSRRRPSTSA